MEIEFKNIGPAMFPQVHRCFHEAFSDYAVDVNYMTEEVIRKRAIKNGIDHDLSMGAFAAGKMVGFTLVGVDDRREKLSAFDIITGIVKAHRGAGLAGQLFTLILEKARKKRIRQFFLEVLCENEAAVKAYRKSGFNIRRRFNCYMAQPSAIKIPAAVSPGILIGSVDREFVDQAKSFTDWEPSWENSFSAIARIPDALVTLAAFSGGRMAGVLVYSPLIRWIHLLAVDRDFRRRGIGSSLLATLLSYVEGDQEIKAINVDSDDQPTNAFLSGCGFSLVTKQYEMILTL